MGLRVFFLAFPLALSFFWFDAPPERGPEFNLIYTVAPSYDPLAWLRAEDRFPQGGALFIRDAKGERPLLPDFAASVDASVSFDATHVLFAGKQHSSDNWQIWEIGLEENIPRKVTDCSEGCVRPLYVSPDRFVYAREEQGRFVIEISTGDTVGEKPLPLTYGPGNAIPLDVLQDGRVLFESGYSLDQSKTSEIYTVYTDGSGVEAYRCDHGRSRYSAKQLDSGDIVFARADGLGRFTSAFAHEVAISAPAGNYTGDVAELPDGAWLVSWRASAKKNFELRRWTPGAKTLRPEIGQPDADVVQPVVLASRPIPNQHPSGLHGWTYANVLCLNAYTSREPFRVGSIASVKVYARASSGSAKLLGTAPVEKDGSFYLRVPGDQPLQIELLDSGGKTLRRESGWFWLRGGEQRVCTGCHAGPETAPENAVPAVLNRSIIPADMTSQHPAAGGH